MRLGFVGLGKLGSPVARTLAAHGHEVIGYDLHFLPPTHEDRAGLNVVTSIAAMVALDPDLIFVAVPTPHGPEYEGVTRLPDTRADFDYTALTRVLADLDALLHRLGTPVVVVSTCLPGTYERQEWGRLPTVRYVHSPSFVSMGNVAHDFLHPEFWLIGTPDRAPCDPLVALYRSLSDAPIVEVDVTTAEAIKVAYNTWIGAKIALANVWGELSDRLGINADEITDALSLATKRIVSPAYMRAGMGDGGPCHPRDLIALSWLAREVGLSCDPFGAIMGWREAHTEWLADEVIPDGPVVLFGGPFKPGVDLTDGSPALLLMHLLDETGTFPVLGSDPEPGETNVIVTAEPRYALIDWPQGSTVVDPFGLIPDQSGVTVIRPGRRSTKG